MPHGKLLQSDFAPYEEKLRAAGQFVTVQRRAILRFLLGNRSHPTTAEIARGMGRNRGASLATVYNNLALFAGLDLIHAVRSPDGETHWDIRTDAHHHLSCTRCGSLLDIDYDLAEVRLHDRKLARRVARAEVWLSGVCPPCDSVTG